MAINTNFIRASTYKPNHLILIKYAIAIAVGLVIGKKVVPGNVMSIVQFAGIAICFWYGIKENYNKLFSVLPYVCYNEAYMRGFIKSFPYLALQYFFIFLFGYLFFKNISTKKAHTNAYLLMLVYGILEFIQSFFPDDPDLLRPIIVNSIALIVIIVWASFNQLTPVIIHKTLTNIKVASIYLASIVYVAHLDGGITYNTQSNFGSSNGLAPVQLSAYLGLGCILLLFSFMNAEERKFRLYNIALFAYSVTVMVLTFSRGGLYFLGIVLLLFFYFNRVQLGKYAKLLFLIPIGLGIFSYVRDQTGGAIVKRYERQDASNRGVLVLQGFRLFFEEPLLGVGTGNYATQVFLRKYYDRVSTAHNEFVRAAAEHGIWGLLCYWGFFILIFRVIILRNGPNKEYSLYFLTLFCLIIIHNGLKISIQPLLMIMAIANPNTLLHKKKAYAKS